MNRSPSISAAPVRSMTGFALVRKETSAGELTISVRAVNHRGLDLHFHSTGELAAFENAMRAMLKQNIVRGHVEIRISLAANTAAECGSYNRELLARYLGLFREACDEFNLASTPDLNVVFTLPGIFNGAREQKALESGFEDEVLDVLGDALRELNSYREREGAELVAGFESEIASIEETTRQIMAIRAEALESFHERLRDRLNALLRDTAMPESRLAEEAALLADRSDVQEELTRLEVHAQELRRILASGGEVGKRLDFLLQEMNREINTVLSKTSGTGETGLTITNLALGTKANIERIREQALNLE